MTRRGGCWPTAHQELLLRAALSTGPACLEAWQRWQGEVRDASALDHGSVRLLPLLYHNLKAHGIDHQWMRLLRGTYRKAWYQNRLLLHHAAELLARLADARLQTIILKGAALASTAYGDLALRPMNDVDLLVRTEDASAAMKVLAELGMRPTHSVAAGRLRLTHSVCFVDTERRQYDLHWHVLEDDCRADADHEFWARAVPLELEGVTTHTLDPADQLIHACAHGARWNIVPPFRWVADVAFLVRAGGIDWDRVTERAERHRVILQVLRPLAYASRLLGLDVSGEVLAELERLPVPSWSRREYRLKCLPQTIPRRIALLWYQHHRLRAGSGGLEILASFPGYLAGRWGLGSASELSQFIRAERAQRRAWRAGRT